MKEHTDKETSNRCNLLGAAEELSTLTHVIFSSAEQNGRNVGGTIRRGTKWHLMTNMPEAQRVLGETQTLSQDQSEMF